MESNLVFELDLHWGKQIEKTFKESEARLCRQTDPLGFSHC